MRFGLDYFSRPSVQFRGFRCPPLFFPPSSSELYGHTDKIFHCLIWSLKLGSTGRMLRISPESSELYTRSGEIIQTKPHTSCLFDRKIILATRCRCQGSPFVPYVLSHSLFETMEVNLWGVLLFACIVAFSINFLRILFKKRQ